MTVFSALLKLIFAEWGCVQKPLQSAPPCQNLLRTANQVKPDIISCSILASMPLASKIVGSIKGS